MTKAPRPRLRHRHYSTESDDSPETRIGQRIEPQPDGCWLYRGQAVDYPHVLDSVPVHRYVYETLVGPIPDGHHLHHRCRVTQCVNPDHLEPLTPSEHARLHNALRKTG